MHKAPGDARTANAQLNIRKPRLSTRQGGETPDVRTDTRKCDSTSSSKAGYRGCRIHHCKVVAPLKLSASRSVMSVMALVSTTAKWWPRYSTLTCVGTSREGFRRGWVVVRLTPLGRSISPGPGKAPRLLIWTIGWLSRAVVLGSLPLMTRLAGVVIIGIVAV